jgi:hypothetical protein
MHGSSRLGEAKPGMEPNAGLIGSFRVARDLLEPPFQRPIFHKFEKCSSNAAPAMRIPYIPPLQVRNRRIGGTFNMINPYGHLRKADEFPVDFRHGHQSLARQQLLHLKPMPRIRAMRPELPAKLGPFRTVVWPGATDHSFHGPPLS